MRYRACWSPGPVVDADGVYAHAILDDALGVWSLARASCATGGGYVWTYGDLPSYLFCESVRGDAERDDALGRTTSRPGDVARRLRAYVARANDRIDGLATDLASGTSEDFVHGRGGRLYVGRLYRGFFGAGLAIAACDGGVVCAHTGDIALHLVRAGRARRVNATQSLLDYLARRGLAIDDATRSTYYANVTLGGFPNPAAVTSAVHVPTEPGDRLVATTHGIRKETSDDDLAAIASSSPPECAARELAARASLPDERWTCEAALVLEAL